MHVEISTDNTINGTADLSAALTGTIRHGLAHFEAHVTRVEAPYTRPTCCQAPHNLRCLR